MPLISARPTSESPTPAQAAPGTGVRKSTSARIGVKTTYRPVMNPVLETVVRSSPAVWKA